MRALSEEVSVGLVAEAESTANMNWRPTPLLQEEPLGLAITPDGVQRSGEPTSMSLALIWPDVAQSGQIQIDVPHETKIEIEGLQGVEKIIEVEVEEDGETVLKKKQRFLFTVKAVGDQPIPQILTSRSPTLRRSMESLRATLNCSARFEMICLQGSEL